MKAVAAPMVLVLVLAAVLRVFQLGEQSLWYDELTTWNRAVIPIDEMFADLFAVRNHTPLYFLLMRGWAAIGDGEFVLRYFSSLWGVLGVALIYRLGVLVGGRRAGQVAAILLAISPFHIWYSQEARMYTMLAALAIIVNWCLLMLMRRERRLLWLAYFLALALAMYTHFLAFLLPVAHYAYLSIHYRRLRAFFLKWLASAAAAVALFALWAGTMLLSGGFREANISWIVPVGPIEPLLTILSLSIGPSIDPASPVPYLALGLFLICLVYGAIRFGRRLPSSAASERVRKALDYRLLLFWCGIPILMLYLISLPWPIPQRRSVYVDRYLIMVLPALLVAAAWGLAALSEKRSRRWLAPVALLVTVLISVATLSNLYGEPDFWREDWRSAVQVLRESAEADDVFLGRPDHMLPLTYYGWDGLQHSGLAEDVSDEERSATFGEEMDRRVSSATADSERVWYINDFWVRDPHGFPQKRNQSLAESMLHSPQKAWLDEQYQLVGEWQFTGIELVLYDLGKP
jgi:4-amino-4-deoxy-L-arabinose transferase-like glycosyltransferase